MATLTRRRSPGPGSASAILWVTAALLFAVLLACAAYYLWHRREINLVDGTGCLARRPAPAAVLFMVDATDRLSAETASYVIENVRDAEARLPRYSRVILVPFEDDTAAPLEPIFSGCLPGDSASAGFDENGRYLQQARDAFDRSLAKLKDQLTALPPSRTSPITAQIVRAASDPVLGWSGDKRRLVLLSDGLESSIYWTRELALPKPPEHLLDGVEAQFIELGNAKAGRLQTEQMRQQWKNWFGSAGAEVRITAPGYAA